MADKFRIDKRTGADTIKLKDASKDKFWVKTVSNRISDILLYNNPLLDEDLIKATKYVQ